MRQSAKNGLWIVVAPLKQGARRRIFLRRQPESAQNLATTILFVFERRGQRGVPSHQFQSLGGGCGMYLVRWNGFCETRWLYLLLEIHVCRSCMFDLSFQRTAP